MSPEESYGKYPYRNRIKQRVYLKEDINDGTDCKNNKVANKCLTRESTHWSGLSYFHDDQCKTESLDCSS